MKFNLIYCDFAWKFAARNNQGTKFGNGMHKYQGMSQAEIKDVTLNYILPIAGNNSAFVNWVVDSKADDYFRLVELLKPYGFRHVTKLINWVKRDKAGNIRKLPGKYSLGCNEDAWLMIRGSMPVKEVIYEGIETLELICPIELSYPVLKPHSKKPDSVRDDLVRLFGDVPRIELFARDRFKYQDGWVNAGNDVIDTKGMDIKEALTLIKEDKY